MAMQRRREEDSATSPVEGEELAISEVPQDWIVQLESRKAKRKIKANPGAAEVWLLERENGAPWRERAERLQQIEDEKAKKEHAQKRITLLSKQTCTGLRNVYGIQFDPSEMAPLLAEASKDMQRAAPSVKSATLLKAVERFDMKAVAKALNINGKAKRSPATLGITTRPPVRPKA